MNRWVIEVRSSFYEGSKPISKTDFYYSQDTARPTITRLGGGEHTPVLVTASDLALLAGQGGYTKFIAITSIAENRAKTTFRTTNNFPSRIPGCRCVYCRAVNSAVGI
jgi:hypothetical protein